MGATKVSGTDSLAIVTDRAEILRDGLEEGQDPSFWIKFQMMVCGALSKIEFSANARRWLAKRDDFGGETWDDKFPTPKVVVRPPLHLEDVISCKSQKIYI